MEMDKPTVTPELIEKEREVIKAKIHKLLEDHYESNESVMPITEVRIAGISAVSTWRWNRKSI